MSRAIVRRLTITGFRSVPGASVELGEAIFLVGRNGSGKSNLVDAIAFLADAMEMPLQAVFDRRGGFQVVRNRSAGQRGRSPNLGIRVDIEGSDWKGHYAFELEAHKHHRFEVLREQCRIDVKDEGLEYFDRQGSDFETSLTGIRPHLDVAALALPLIGGDARLGKIVTALSAMRTYSIVPSLLREMQDPDAGSAAAQRWEQRGQRAS